ncbi:MAG: GH92 family glycosyl hydrolase [Chitinophagaceae bacterium]|nr:GH92 family glycosyl hydrolase [Chitinophagaceae bacterium]
MIIRFLSVCLLFLFFSSCSNNHQQKEAVDYVDPFIGTGGHGHTYPGAVLPFGMVQLSPDNGTQGWDWCSGYHYSDSVIVGFSHTHLSGTGIGDLLDISMMPSVGKSLDTIMTPSSFSHKDESASPGYYSVKLKDYNILSELTVSKHIGWQRHTFPKSKNAMLRIDLGWAINWDKPTECFVKKMDDSTIVGYRFSEGWAKGQKVFFALRSGKIKEATVKMIADKIPAVSDSAKGVKVIAGIEFETDENEQVIFKTGISFADVSGAISALDQEKGYNFEAIRQEARKAWQNELDKVDIVAEDTIKTIFYTSLYHSFLAPSLYSDANGNYKGADSLVKNSSEEIYSVHSLWDTFRGANPLFTLLQPSRVPLIINSFLAFYEQHGLLPVWDLHFWETNTMTGYHSVPIIADAILKGIKGFDYEKAYEAMKASTNQNIRATDHYRKFGYVPQDKHGWSVTITLEYAFDDWCIAQVAKKLGKEEDYTEYSKRAENYKNLFDPESGFFRAKNSSGKWVEPFDPMHSEHGFDGMYIEGTAWQHTFFVPHAIKQYAELMGGDGALINKLDSLFTNNKPMTGENISSDISGLIGQYAHGNEPSHHIAYMYAALGAPDKGSRRIREILTKMYSTKPDGLSGNEDCGQMSAWYVWSALGFYPMNPASGEYILGSPIIRRAFITLDNGKKIEILVNGLDKDKAVIQSAKWNGLILEKNKITHAELMEGGKLEFTLTN